MKNFLDPPPGVNGWHVLIVVAILVFLVWGSSKAQDMHPLVQQFYADAASRGVNLEPVKVRVFVGEMREAVNGKISKLPDGSYAITIEQQFYNYYQGASQLQRLVYYLLAHELLDVHVYKHGIMNSEHVYYRLTTKLIDKLFQKTKTV